MLIYLCLNIKSDARLGSTPMRTFFTSARAAEDAF